MPTQPKKKFSELVKELEMIVEKLESGKVDDLDEMVAEYERAAQLAADLKKRISEAEVKIQKIKSSTDTDGETDEDA